MGRRRWSVPPLLPVLGANPPRTFFFVNVGALDVDPAELAPAPIRYLDGRNDRFDRAPAERGFSVLLAPLMTIAIHRANRKDLAMLKHLL